MIEQRKAGIEDGKEDGSPRGRRPANIKDNHQSHAKGPVIGLQDLCDSRQPCRPHKAPKGPLWSETLQKFAGRQSQK